jgi:hypothetical protein
MPTKETYYPDPDAVNIATPSLELYWEKWEKNDNKI